MSRASKVSHDAGQFQRSQELGECAGLVVLDRLEVVPAGARLLGDAEEVDPGSSGRPVRGRSSRPRPGRLPGPAAGLASAAAWPAAEHGSHRAGRRRPPLPGGGPGGSRARARARGSRRFQHHPDRLSHPGPVRPTVGSTGRAAGPGPPDWPASTHCPTRSSHRPGRGERARRDREQAACGWIRPAARRGSGNTSSFCQVSAAATWPWDPTRPRAPTRDDATAACHASYA